MLKRPTEPDTFRWLTVRELRRLHDIPDSYLLPDEKIVSGEMIGQGVVVSLFCMIIEAVTGRSRALGGGGAAGQFSLSFAG